jgi:hypothetical protein
MSGGFGRDVSVLRSVFRPRAICGIVLTLTLLHVVPHLLDLASTTPAAVTGDRVRGGDFPYDDLDGGVAMGEECAAAGLDSPMSSALAWSWPWWWLWPWSDTLIHARAACKHESALLAAVGFQGVHVRGLWVDSVASWWTGTRGPGPDRIGGASSSLVPNTTAVTVVVKELPLNVTLLQPPPAAAAASQVLRQRLQQLGRGDLRWRRAWQPLLDGDATLSPLLPSSSSSPPLSLPSLSASEALAASRVAAEHGAEADAPSQLGALSHDRLGSADAAQSPAGAAEKGGKKRKKSAGKKGKKKRPASAVASAAAPVAVESQGGCPRVAVCARFGVACACGVGSGCDVVGFGVV